MDFFFYLKMLVSNHYEFHTMYFDHIPPLLQPSPDPPLAFIPTQPLFQFSMYCLYTLWCGTTQRDVVNLSTATPLKKTSSPSHNSY